MVSAIIFVVLLVSNEVLLKKINCWKFDECILFCVVVSVFNLIDKFLSFG